MKQPARFNLSDWTLRHRALVGYFMFAIALMGIYGYTHLGQSEDPPFTFKIMVVRTFWPGATAQEVERQLTDKIEKKLQETPWVDRVSSFSKPGESTVLFFAKDATPKKAVPDVYYQVRKKIGDIRHTLPAGAIGPFFNDEFGDVFGNLYAITGNGLSYAQLKANAEHLRDELLRVKNVGKVELFGVQDEKIFVEISNSKLATLGLDQNSILQALSQQNAVAGGGYYETSNERIFIRPGGAFSSVEAVRDTLIRAGVRSFRLGDIAEIKRGTVEPAAPMVRHQGKPAILVGVAMVQGGDIIQLGKDLRQQISAFQAKLPLGVDIGETASQPDAVKRSISEFVRVLAEAVIVVLVVNFLSLGLRTGLVVAISIPLVLAASFFCMYWLDIGLHKVSLGALVMALGLLVDDAIIAVEMMWVKMEQGWDRARAAAFAYTSTAGPMLSGTLVTVAGFLPIAIAQSAVGEYAVAFFEVNAVALIISWLTAVVAIPWLGYKLLPDPHAQEKGFLHRHIPRLLDAMHRLGLGNVPHAKAEDIYNTPFYRRFRRTVSFAIARRWLVIAVTFGLFVLSILGMGLVQKQFFPNSTRFELMVELRLAEGTSITAVEREVKKLENWLQEDNTKHKDFDNFTAFVGSGAPRYFLALDQILPANNVGQFVIQTRSLTSREALRSRLITLFDKDFQSLRANVTRIENGPPVGYPVQYRVSGTDIAKLREISSEIASVLRKAPELSNINMDWDELSKTVSIEIDQDKARLLDVSSQDIANFVTMSLTGYAVTTYREADQSIDIVVRDDQTTRAQLSALSDLAIPTRAGKSVPLAQIGQLKYGFEPNLIWRRDRLPTITVRANLYGEMQAATLTERLAPQIKAIEDSLPQGFSLATGGTVEESAKGQDPVIAGMPIFVLVVVTILMLQLQNFSRVVMVLLTAPLGIIGIALFLLVFQQPFGFMALLGSIALFGMIMRNSVILVDQIDQDMAAGRSQFEAIVESAVRRFRPIVLTAAAAVLAMVPLSRNEFFGPMAIAIMGGLIVATALTLIFLPALYAAWYRVESN